MDYEKLKEVIAKQIKENGRGEITGPVLQAVLMTMVDSLGEVYPQTYTDEQKAQARANIDALSNYDGEITKEKLSAEVQAILDDVANKQNITDESLATIAKTIVGAINEVYKGGLEDASIATSKIEDGAVTTDKLADTAVTEDKLASQSVSSKKIKDATIGASKLGAKSVTEPKLNDVLVAKVNNNVKTVEQTLSDDEVKIASKNLKFRDNTNFFADYYSYNKALSSTSRIPSYSIFGGNCYGNKFDNASSNIFGNNFDSNEFATNCIGNIFGNRCSYNTAKYNFYDNIIGNNCAHNIFGVSFKSNIIGNNVSNNIFGNYLTFCKVGNGVSYIELKSKANSERYLKNIHILSGVKGNSATERLVINIPDEYLNSSRELIITTKRTDGGPSTPEDLVMYYADEVVDKQNKQDNTLETTSKEVVGAINELFNGGVKDKSIGASKLAQAVQDTLGKVGMNVKVLPKGTNLLAGDLEDGIWLAPQRNTDYQNFPTWFSGNTRHLCILFVSSGQVFLIGTDNSSYLTYAYKPLLGTGWLGIGKPLNAYLAPIEDIITKYYTGSNKDLKSSALPKGIWFIEKLGEFTNVPPAFDINSPVILISTDNRIGLFGCEKGSYGFSQYAWRERNTTYWLAANYKYEDVFVKNGNSLTDTEVNNIWDNN
nr:MAG TPA: hypothetical protein [Caudoviricetes sp.]